MSTQYGCFKKIVFFAPKKHQFKRNGTTLRGILKPIKRLFAPHYDFNDATEGTEHERENKVDRRSVARNKAAGLAKGRRVDTQMSRAFVFMSQFKLSIADFLNLRRLSIKGKRSAKMKAAINLSKSLMSNVRALLTRWAHRGLKIVATQLPVGCVAKKLGTAIDVVLTDAKGNYYIINVKVDSWKNYDKHTGHPLEAPYNHSVDLNGKRVYDSKRNQNQLQLLAETILWHKTYSPVGSGQPYQVPIDPSKRKSAMRTVENKLYPEINTVDAEGIVREFPLQQWVIDKQNEFWSRL
jgi:hypothetical protein